MSTANELGRGPLFIGSVVGCILAGDLIGEVMRGAFRQPISEESGEGTYKGYRHSS